MQLQGSIDALTATGTLAIAIAQEDKTLAEFASFQASGFDPAPRFELVADLGHVATKRYDRTSAYLVDESGIVREIFPMLLRHRASWESVIDEIARRRASEE